MNKYNLTAIAAAMMAMGMSGIANAGKPGGDNPPPKQELPAPSTEAGCESSLEEGFWFGAAWENELGSCSEEFVEAQEYGGDMTVDVDFTAECEFEPFLVEGSVTLEFSLGSDVAVECFGPEMCFCAAEFHDEGEGDFFAGVETAAIDACPEGEFVSFGELSTTTEMTRKFLNPGHGGGHHGRQNHLITITECDL
jgi:hypothetical protein